MKLGLVPDNFLERVALSSGQLPVGVIECWMGIMLSRCVMAGTKLDIFESLADGPLTSSEVAQRCGTHGRATQQLLNALVGVGCLQTKGGRYRLRPSSRAWLLKREKDSFRDQNLMHYLEWRWWEHCEDYVRTGQPLHVHRTMSEEEWGLYQRGMRSGVSINAHWVARNLPAPKGAQKMLDIGGSHGYYSVSMCRRHANLRSTILDLPEAIRHAAPLLAKEQMGDRVVYREGNALVDDLGAEAYDVVFMAALVHHFDDATNRQLMERIARALKPGGVVAIWEPVRQEASGTIRQIGSLFDLFFGMTSESGTWSRGEVAEWFRAAGLSALPARSPRMMPDLALHLGKKRA